MSVSLYEVLTSAGFDIRENPEDAEWLLSRRNEFEELCEQAEELLDSVEEENEDECD